MLPISVCIIAKNEEQHIEECLKRLSVLDWEIIVVDTGSTDRTVEIARFFTEQVYHFAWINDFSAARNYAASKASFDWILAIDCDEYLEAESAALFAEWFETNCADHTDSLGRFSIKNSLNATGFSDDSAGSFAEYSTESVTRLYHRRHFHFEGNVHEQIRPLSGTCRQTVALPLSFLHMGYATQEIRLQKAKRNIALLTGQLQHSGPSCYVYYQLGQCYFSINEYQQAAAYYEKAFDLADYPFPDYIQTLMESYGYCLIELKKFQHALNLLSPELYGYFSKHADFVFLAGLIYMNNGLLEQAINEFMKATAIPSCRDKGVNSYKAYYNIGVIYECCGNTSLALSFYEKCGSYAPACNRINVIK